MVLINFRVDSAQWVIALRKSSSEIVLSVHKILVGLLAALGPESKPSQAIPS